MSMAKKVASDFERVFLSIDKDGDGKISAAELQQCMRAVGQDLDAGDIEALPGFDENGLMGFEELVKLVNMEDGEATKMEELREAFEMFEMEGEGVITAESLKRMLEKLGESKGVEECKAMIRSFDLNGDGVLSFDEFKKML